MSCVAEFTIPPDSVPFGETLVENPDIRIEVERIVPTDESALPFFWVWGSEPERFIEEAEAEPDVVDTQLLEAVEGGGLFRATWSPNAAVIRELEALDVTIIESEGTSEQWRFEIRTQDRTEFSTFQEVFQDAGIPISLTRIFDLDELVESEHRTVTPKQRETLVQAYKEGYFESPRQVTQEELGDEFDISHRAVSERLRRGVRNLIATTLLPKAQSE